MIKRFQIPQLLLICVLVLIFSSSLNAFQSSSEERPKATQQTPKPEPVPAPDDSSSEIKRLISLGIVKIGGYGRGNYSLDLIGFQGRMVGARLKPHSKNGSKGTLELLPQEASLQKIRGLPSKEEYLWELNYLSQSSGEPTVASDTEIVGGEVSPKKFDEKIDSCDLLISIKEVYDPKTSEKNGSSTTSSYEYEYKWALKLRESQSGIFTAFGKLIGHEKKTYILRDSDGTSSTETITHEYRPTGETVAIYRKISNYGMGGTGEKTSKTVWHSNGEIEEIVDGKSTTRNGNPVILEQQWFVLAVDKKNARSIADIADMYADCNSGSSAGSAEYEAEKAENKKNATSMGKTGLLINGKEFQIEIFQWDNPDSASVEPGMPISKIYLPKKGASTRFMSGARLANELGNLVADGRDGTMDGICATENGRPLSFFGAEAESDAFSEAWLRRQAATNNIQIDGAPEDRFNIVDYFPTNEQSRALLASVLTDQIKIADPVQAESWLRKEIDFYRKRSNDLRKASDLISKGKYKEAYEYLQASEQGKGYACRVPYQAELHLQASQEK